MPHRSNKLSLDKRKIGLFLAVAPPFSGVTHGMVNAIFMLLGLQLMISDGSIVIPKSILRWAISFAGFCLLSFFWAHNTSTVFSTTASYLQIIVLVLVIVIGARNDVDTLFVVKCMIFGAAIYTIRLLATNSLSYLFTVGRIGGGNTLAIRFTMLSVIIFMNRKRFKNQILPYVFIVSFSTVGFLQGSRKGFIIFTVGMTLAMLFEARTSRNLSKTVRYLLLIILFAVALYSVCMYTALYNSIGIRIERTINYYINDIGTLDSSTRDRSLLISEAIKIWKDHPILGCGQDNFRYINSVRYGYYAHNNYMELLANLGIVGFVLYYAFYLKMLLMSIANYKQRKDKSRIIPLVVFILALAIDYMMVSYSSEGYYVFIGYAIAVMNSTVNNELSFDTSNIKEGIMNV